MKKFLLSCTLLVGLAGCSNLYTNVSENKPDPDAVAIQSRRECDVPMTWGYVKPDDATPAKFQSLIGLWTGAVKFEGSGAELCVAMAVESVTVAGQTDTIFVWNLGDNSESTNALSIGQANWWADTDILDPARGEQLVFAANKPYRGMWYRYVLNFPTAANPDVITGHLIAYTYGSASDSSKASWHDERQTWKVKFRRNKDSYVPFAVPAL